MQYLTDAPGFQIAQTGDSVPQAPTDDSGVSNWMRRACWTISTPLDPCEFASFAWGGQATAVYDESFRQNIAAIKPSAMVWQAVSRNDALTAAGLNLILSKALSYATEIPSARIGFQGAWPMTTSADGTASAQNAIIATRNRLNTISKTCQPSTGGIDCPKVPVLDPVPYVSRQPFGGNLWDYDAISTVANGAVAAGGTTITGTNSGTTFCYAGDQIRDITTPAAIAPGSTVTSCSGNSVTVPGTVVVGGGILNGDVLEFAVPGYTFGSETEGKSTDNTHPSFVATSAVAAATLTFLKQLIGYQ